MRLKDKMPVEIPTMWSCVPQVTISYGRVLFVPGTQNLTRRARQPTCVFVSLTMIGYDKIQLTTLLELVSGSHLT